VPFDVLAADAHQVGRGRRVRLVDLALVAALDDRLLGHGGAGAGGHDQHRVGVGGVQLQACGVTLVSVRAKRSAATIFMPFFSASAVAAFSHSSP
jgi:hypothetical protein